GSEDENALEICGQLDEPTLIFCKSVRSAYALASFLIEKGVSAPSPQAKEVADWLRKNYHPEWILAHLLDQGFAVHHGSLPRSIAYHILRKFNDGAIRFLLCTSTIIEGVNTSAKNIVIYDNKIATRKFDQFTFNNIKGRAGRMFKHFVGHVYVLHPEPELELPIVDIPSITQSDGAPDSLLIHLDHGDLSDRSREQLRYLHAQEYLPIDVIRESSGVEPSYQVNLAAEIASKLDHYYPLLMWRGFPNSEQLFECCRLIFEFLLGNNGRDGIVSVKQLYFQISRFAALKSIPALIDQEIENPHHKTPSDAIESTLKFLRQWCEFHFPRLLGSLERIQRSVFESNGRSPGDYAPFIASVKHLFMHPAVTILEEYGLPYSVTQKVLATSELGGDVDEILGNLSRLDPASVALPPFEEEMLRETLDNL
ncbi:MAG: helicase-related protein, partial [Verrucomicrobiales bacterium]